MTDSWNDIVHVAMLGTDKRQLNEASLPEGIKQNAALIQEKISDKEEQFLALASLVFNYRQCGVMPLGNKETLLVKADAEECEYANPLAHQVLNDILVEDSQVLLKLWLQLCSNKTRIVQPETIPQLLDMAVKHKSLQALIVQCTGKRGTWLSTLNESWKFGAAQADDEIWQTGTLEQRRVVLQNIRKNDAAKGRELLQSVWAQENAATKSELLKQLSVGIGNDDAPWLETLLTDKSEKVKEAATELLKQIPSSSIVHKFQEVLQQSVKFKEGKKILGIGSKSDLTLDLPASVDEIIFKRGIEKLSNKKGFSDNEYIIYQLIKQVPPSFWQETLQIDIAEIVALFSVNKNKKYLFALGSAATLFASAEWLRAIIKADEKHLYLDAFSLLPQNEWETYALPFIESEETATQIVLELTTNGKAEWSMALAKAVFQFTAKRPYQYQHSFYNKYIQLVPTGIVAELEQCTPAEEYSKSAWSKTSDYISKLLNLKAQTFKAFG